ncbi:hypothetical protein ABE26_10375 [Cytobacillus firmus]|nr:hypothetical protein [Cytobacillus firmus]
MKNLPNSIWRVIWRAFKSITRENKYFYKKFLTPISWFDPERIEALFAEFLIKQTGQVSERGRFQKNGNSFSNTEYFL